MKLNQAIVTRILELCNERNWTINQLATESGIIQSTINCIVSGKSKNPKSETIFFICEGFGISLEEFYSSDIFKNIEY